MEKLTPEAANRADQLLKDDPDFSIVLVCWNNRDYLEPCLDSLHSDTMRSKFEVVVVDNGSTDGSQEMLREKYPQVQIIQNDHNVGLGRASNQGIESTTGRYVLLLNNDTIVNGASLDAFVDFLDSTSTAGAVGGRLLNPDGSIQACYNDFPTLSEEFLIASRLGEFFREGYPAKIRGDEVLSVSWLSSACVMLRRTALAQVGLLDEEYFIYGDEVDLQYRMKQAGWSIYYLPEAYTIHYGGRSMNRWGRRKMVYRGKILFFHKNYGVFQTSMLRLMLGGMTLSKMLVWGAVSLVPQRRDRALKELRSNIDVIKVCYRPV